MRENYRKAGAKQKTNSLTKIFLLKTALATFKFNTYEHTRHYDVYVFGLA